MIGPAAIGAFALFAAGVYLMLSTSLQRVVIGFILLSNGVNILVLASAGLPEGAAPPIVGGAPAGPFADPLAHAFLLTAIVIGLGMTSFLLALSLRAHAHAPAPGDGGGGGDGRGDGGDALDQGPSP
ncbi:uncharacterized protein SOCEGT47_063150 [Sorangium cellulosum]|uniref:Cation:proton antiporter n=1 Tax=Sorangium cellulosum TaxID=56 RepID=A0A4P2Q866_SORCE|nr:NADH-quinone oxidoreductase subunit K [Sorangium cellulosum]AUX25764.1 uncharacterized protein SOCEGT47_063150 [Sorangium cellulosum]